MKEKYYSPKRKIINRISIYEKIKFRGEKLVRERIEKEFNLPKMVTEDIGFQLQFGFDSPIMCKKSKYYVPTVSLDYNK